MCINTNSVKGEKRPSILIHVLTVGLELLAGTRVLLSFNLNQCKFLPLHYNAVKKKHHHTHKKTTLFAQHVLNLSTNLGLLGKEKSFFSKCVLICQIGVKHSVVQK